MNDTEKSESDVATEGNQQPDLAALSRGLPFEWQVFSDPIVSFWELGGVDRIF